MPSTLAQSYPIINFPYLYKYGMQLSRLSDTSLAISPGACRDDNDVIDIEISGTNVEGNNNPVALLLDYTRNGINGLDAGVFERNQMYSIYVIADSHYNHPTACVSCVALDFPVIPSGYDSKRLIGYWSSQSGSEILSFGAYSGLGTDLKFTYANSQSIGVNATTSVSSFTLFPSIPPVQNCLVAFYNVVSSAVVGNRGAISTNFAQGTPYVLYAYVVNVNSPGYAECVSQVDPGTGYPFIQARCLDNITNISVAVVGFSVSV